jgi:ribosomal protein S20
MQRLLITAAVFAFALAAPAPALADLGPDDIGASAFTRIEAETFARDASLQKWESWNETITGTTGASSSYRLPPSFGGEVFTCPATGCAGFDGGAMGSAEVSAGLLRAVATARLYVGNAPNDGYGLAGLIVSDGRATIADTITLSKPATVVLKGRVTGHMGGSADINQQPWPDAQLLAAFSFTGERICDGGECIPRRFGGYERRYDAPVVDCPATDGSCLGTAEFWASAGEQVDDSFEVHVALPAGTSNFTAKLLALVDFQVHGMPLVLASSHAFLDFGNSAVFEIQVPDDVVASSGSGLLPIVGGTGGDPETPSDTQAPVLQLPADLTAEATGPGGTVVSYTAGAADDGDPSPSVSCTPPSGSTFPLGTTSVACTARDAAGNEATGSFTVRVVDTTAPVLSLEKVARTIRTYHFVGAIVPALPVEATDLVDPAPLVLCTPAAGERLAVGETVVRCTATDDAGNRAEASVAIVVLGPLQLVSELIGQVRAAGLDPDTEDKLLTPLERARLALMKTRVDSAETALEAFVGEVEKQSQKGGIAPENAMSFVGAAERIVRGVFPLVSRVAEKIGQIVTVLVPGSGPQVQRFLALLRNAQGLAAAGEKGRALAKLREAQDELDALVVKGLVTAEVGSAAERDISALLATLSGSAKDANPKG